MYTNQKKCIIYTCTVLFLLTIQFDKLYKLQIRIIILNCMLKRLSKSLAIHR